MDIEYLEKLIKLISESHVDEIEIEEEGKKIRIAKSAHVVAVPPPAPVPVQQIAIPVPQGDAGTVSVGVPPTGVKYHEIRSPIVGTFYRAPAPDAASFVEVGTQIASGTVLCIVEAMKLMNEIESDVSGKIHKVMVENGQPVEYDQVLFLVEKA